MEPPSPTPRNKAADLNRNVEKFIKELMQLEAAAQQMRTTIADTQLRIQALKYQEAQRCKALYFSTVGKDGSTSIFLPNELVRKILLQVYDYHYFITWNHTNDLNNLRDFRNDVSKVISFVSPALRVLMALRTFPFMGRRRCGVGKVVRVWLNAMLQQHMSYTSAPQWKRYQCVNTLQAVN